MFSDNKKSARAVCPGPLLCSPRSVGLRFASSSRVGDRGPLGSCSSLSKLSSLQLMDRVHTTGRGVPGRAGNLQLEGSSTAVQCSTVCACTCAWTSWAARWPRSSRLDAIHRYFKDVFKEFNVRVWQWCSFQTLIKLAWLMRCFTLLPPPPCFFCSLRVSLFISSVFYRFRAFVYQHESKNLKVRGGEGFPSSRYVKRCLTPSLISSLCVNGNELLKLFI